MSPEIIGALGILVMVILMLMRMWIGAAMAITGFVGYAILRSPEGALSVLGQIPFSTANFHALTTVPLFVFMGVILFNAGIGKDLYDTMYKWVGQFRGGLAMATISASAIFGAITGIPTPALVTMGKVAIPEMKKYGYSESFAAGSVVCAGTLAILIPPSIPMIIYAILTENSVGKLFMAGILPGIVLTILFIITVMITTGLNKRMGPAGPKTSLRVKAGAVKGIWPTAVLFILVLGGIYGGIFTPTEAGGVGAFGACVITTAMRRLNFKMLAESLLEAARMTAMILFLIIGAFLLMKFMAVSRLPALMGNTVMGMDIPVWAVFLVIILIYVVLGMLLDIMSAVMITIPIIYPIILSMGFDPIWFGVVIILIVQMGLVTPPIGLDVFILSTATKIPLFTIFRGVAPYVVADLVCIIILMIFPDIALIIPRTM